MRTNIVKFVKRHKYAVAITETRRLVVCVEAASEAGAKRRVLDAWRNGEVLLKDHHFDGLAISVIGDAGKNPSLLKVEKEE